MSGVVIVVELWQKMKWIRELPYCEPRIKYILRLFRLSPKTRSAAQAEQVEEHRRAGRRVARARGMNKLKPTKHRKQSNNRGGQCRCPTRQRCNSPRSWYRRGIAWSDWVTRWSSGTLASLLRRVLECPSDSAVDMRSHYVCGPSGGLVTQRRDECTTWSSRDLRVSCDIRTGRDRGIAREERSRARPSKRLGHTFVVNTPRI